MPSANDYVARLLSIEDQMRTLLCDVGNARATAISNGWNIDADTTTIDTHMTNLKSGLDTMKTAAAGLVTYGQVGDQA